MRLQVTCSYRSPNVANSSTNITKSRKGQVGPDVFARRMVLMQRVGDP